MYFFNVFFSKLYYYFFHISTGPHTKYVVPNSYTITMALLRPDSGSLPLEACCLPLAAWSFSQLLFRDRLIIDGHLDPNPAPVIGHEPKLSVNR